ncbi:hypothetical protein FPOA_06797 [Fusarium poae]|uniref:Uncharacterized protein n=1 Tax=Fusarium poae TaxID=36050 RepID=A0A1B8AJ01_FUSPO|nr:hypothetical protein FPOA_06797 [Fusarium poae]
MSSSPETHERTHDAALESKTYYDRNSVKAMANISVPLIYKTAVKSTKDSYQATHQTTFLANLERNMKLAIVIVALATAAYAVKIPCTGTTSLREEAAKKNLLFGSGAINPAYLDDAQFKAVLSKQFNSLSPENELK